MGGVTDNITPSISHTSPFTERERRDDDLQLLFVSDGTAAEGSSSSEHPATAASSSPPQPPAPAATAAHAATIRTSPLKSATVPSNNNSFRSPTTHEDTSSFHHLFGEGSFDMLSEEASDQYSLSVEDHHHDLSSPTTSATTGGVGRYRHHHQHHLNAPHTRVFTPTNNGAGAASSNNHNNMMLCEIALPEDVELKQASTADTSDNYSLGDCSPIKVVYNNNNNNGCGTSFGVVEARRLMEEETFGFDYHHHHHNHGIEMMTHNPHAPIAATTTTKTTAHHQPWNHNKAPPPPPPETVYFPDAASPDHRTCTTSTGSHNKNSNTNADVGPVSNPFYVLRSVQKAFEGCKYLLSCLFGGGQQNLCPVNIITATNGHIHHYRGEPVSSSFKIDIATATRRVETAICAFGGTLDCDTHINKQKNSGNNESSSTSNRSIFRLRGYALQRQFYEQRMPHRYYLSGSSIISWEVEEDPPIYVPSVEGREPTDGGTKGAGDNHRSSQQQQRRSEVSRYSHGGTSTPTSLSETAESPTNSRGEDAGQNINNSKMKYRCKLCGQLKQNHECSYRQSLHRSIGIMVFPAVNAFTAAEPGTIAPALSQMNNFVSYDSPHHDSCQEPPPASSSFTTNHQAGFPLVRPGTTTITPASIHAAGGCFSSPQSSLSHDHSDEGVAAIPPRRNLEHGLEGDPGGDGPFRKRSIADLEHGDPTATATNSPPQRSVFVASVPLRPEHYRAVTPSASSNTASSPSADYQYPAIPLTFTERKRLSDSLFYLSKEIPSVTAECATILREARKNNEWDLAVAELLTQVVVGLYCGEGDTCLEGLQQYLLGLGISC